MSAVTVIAIGQLSSQQHDLQSRKKGKGTRATFITMVLGLVGLFSQKPQFRQILNMDLFHKSWDGKNVYKQYAKHPYEFCNVVGETVESFNELFASVHIELMKTKGGPRLSPRNNLMMTLIWLRSYPTYTFLSLVF